MSKFTEYRREFHKYPENGWREIRTSARIAEILTDMGYTCLMGPDVVNVDNFLAMHVALSAENKPLPSHTVACGCKDFLSDRQLDITFHGRAAHIA